MRRIVRTLVGMVVAVFVMGTLAVLPASASGGIGINQHFHGVVNGKHVGAVIYTACPGPVDSDDTGPIVGGQTVAAKQVAAGGGDTGQGASFIYARVTPTVIVTIDAYGDPEAIPTSGQVPCSGKGVVTFTTCPVPQPCGAGATPDNVPVTYLNIAV